jgi:3-oxoacyl-[acyl-carrier protein] reductase
MEEIRKAFIDFSNKFVLITGGSRGIGKACAKLFSDFNANVIITYKSNIRQAENTLRELNNNKNQHSLYRLDISSGENVEMFFNELIKKYNRIDVLINNAGVYIEHKITEVTYEEWQSRWSETISTNLTGVSNLCYFISRQMIKNGGGKIINISSRGAFRGEPDYPAYGASKAGLNSLSQSLARALAQYNIIVGAIAPGYVNTDMAADILNSEKGARIKGESPLNRVASPLEIAKMAAVFASDGFEYMTGSIVDINGASYLRT